jgi:hypothetical protein
MMHGFYNKQQSLFLEIIFLKTFYLRSPSGSGLIEIGSETGKEVFVIESLGSKSHNQQNNKRIVIR